MRGHIGKPEFPQWLGNNSKKGKYDRILQELQHHSRLTYVIIVYTLQYIVICSCSCNKREFSMDYLMYLRNKLTCPLTTKVHIAIMLHCTLVCSKGTEGVPEVVEGLNEYNLTREDWDNLIEVGHYSGVRNVAAQIEPKVCSLIGSTNGCNSV